eukprot:3811074-Pleurochrysis_carterae.AAC.2
MHSCSGSGRCRDGRAVCHALGHKLFRVGRLEALPSDPALLRDGPSSRGVAHGVAEVACTLHALVHPAHLRPIGQAASACGDNV